MHEMNHRCNVGRKLLDANNASYAKEIKVIAAPSSMFSDNLPKLQCTFSQTPSPRTRTLYEE